MGTPSPRPAELAPGEAEIARLKARGGVDLSRVEDPWERFVVASDIRAGAHNTGRTFRFRCPTCRTVYVNDQEMEVLCTGPHPSLDEHEPTVTERVHD